MVHFFGRRAATPLTVLFLALLPPAFFWRETLGRLTLADQDAVFWFFPVYKLVAEEIRAGRLPLWNPYLYSGGPLFGQWQAGVLDPLNWLYLFGVTSRIMTLAQELSFALALVATFAYGRSLGLARRASVVAAVIYALSGYAVGRTLYPGLLHITALAPLVLCLIEHVRGTGRWRDVFWGALVVAWQLFAAHPQPFVYSAMLAGAYALFRAWGAASRARFLVQCAVIYVGGAALAAVQLLPAWEVARSSVRQQWPYELFTLHSLHPVSLLGTLFPYLHGQGQMSIYRMPYWGNYWHHNEGQIYLGALALALAVSGAVAAWRGRWGVGRFWSAAGVVAVLLAMGKYAGPLAWLLYRVPLLGNFRSPNRHWMEVTLAVAVLAGYGVDLLLRGAVRSVGRAAQVAAAALALLCTLVGGLVLWRRAAAEALIRALPDLAHLPRGFLRGAGAEFSVPIIAALVALAAILVFARAPQRRYGYAFVLALLIADYQLYAYFAPISNPVTRLETLIGQAMPPELAAKESEREPLRSHVALTPTAGEFNPFWFYGHEMATGYDPIVNERYKTFSGIDEAGRSHLRTMTEPQDRTLDLLNVRYLMVAPTFLDQMAAGNARLAPGGMAFADEPSAAVELRPGGRATFSAAGRGDTLAIVSALANAAAVADGAEVAEVSVGCGSGPGTVVALRAGRETAEWAYDRADVRPRIRHARPPLAESRPGDQSGSFEAHSYLARLPLPPAAVRCASPPVIQISSKAGGNVVLTIKHLALYDSATVRATPLTPTSGVGLGDPARWRELSARSEVRDYRNFQIYENLRAQPRVWLVGRVLALPEAEQLRLIRGEMADAQGRSFDPREVALVDPEVSARLGQGLRQPGAGDPQGTAKILRRTPLELTVETQAARPAMLVLSELSFPGWHARVDGGEAPVWRVDYILRGVELRPGRHLVELFYRPPSVLRGASISGVAALALGIMLWWDRRRAQKESE